METRDLRYFLTICEQKSLSSAAKALCISEPPLSRWLKKFEKQCGGSLFTRSNGIYLPTNLGEYLREQAENFIELSNKIDNGLSEMTGGGQVRISIGTIETVGMSLLSEWIAGFHRIHPEVTYQVVNSHTDDIIEKLRYRVFDIGIVREPFNSLGYETLQISEEPWVAIISREHPLSGEVEPTLDLCQLADEPLIAPARTAHATQMETWFGEIGVKPNIICTYNAILNGLALARQNVGIMLSPMVPGSNLNLDLLTVKKIVNPKLTSRSILVCDSKTIHAPVIDDFIRYIRQGIKSKKNS